MQCILAQRIMGSSSLREDSSSIELLREPSEVFPGNQEKEQGRIDINRETDPNTVQAHLAMKFYRSIFLILLGIITLGAFLVVMKERSQKLERWDGRG